MSEEYESTTEIERPILFAPIFAKNNKVKEIWKDTQSWALHLRDKRKYPIRTAIHDAQHHLVTCAAASLQDMFGHSQFYTALLFILAIDISPVLQESFVVNELNRGHAVVDSKAARLIVRDYTDTCFKGHFATENYIEKIDDVFINTVVT